MSAPRICGRPTNAGKPCGQVLGDSARECIWHGESVTAEDRSLLAQRGGLTKLRVLPPDRPKPDLSDVRGIRKELTSLIHAVKVGTLAPEPGRVAILGLGVAVKLGELELHGLISDLEKRVEKRLPRRLA
jgi:hypothetical protein